MKFKEMFNKVVEFKESIKAKQKAKLDEKVEKANTLLAEQQELAKKLKIIDDANKLKEKNKKLMFEQSNIGKIVLGIKKAQEKTKKNNSKKHKIKIKDNFKKTNYDPWNIKSGPFK